MSHRVKQLDKELEVVHTIQLAYVGWECDSEGWLVKDKNNKHYVVLTSHGSPYFATLDELNEVLQSYVDLTRDITRAIGFLAS